MNIMKTRLKNITTLLSATLIVLITSSCVPESDGINVAVIPLRWDASSLPLTVKVDANIVLPAADDDTGINDQYDLFEEMQKEWNDADTTRTFFVLDHNQNTAAVQTADLDSYYDGEVGIYLSDNWFSEIGYGVLAITSYFAENRGDYYRLVHGDIMVNNLHYNYTFDKLNTSTAFYDMPSVILHELGHLLGLKHTTSSSVESIMYPQLGGGEKKRSLSFFDSQSITNLYNNSALALSALSVSSSASLDASTQDSDKPKYIRGYIELRADGTCHHYQEGKLVEVHKAPKNLKR